MSKRVRFDEENLEERSHKFPKYGEDTNPHFKLRNNQEEQTDGKLHSSRLKLDNSLDSDEEEDDKKLGYEKLKEDDVEGAEDDYAGEEVGITPFNLKEEMEEGDFDVQGNYHFKKENIIRDEWLDNIDWMKVKKRKEVEDVDDSWDEDGKGNPDFDELDVLKKMVGLMQPGETVTRALRRLGGKQAKNRQKKRDWRKEKVYDLEAKDEPDTSTNNTAEEEEKKQKDLLLQLTGLADEMMGAGHYDVYVDSYEKFQYKIKSLEAEKKAKEPQIPEDADDDDALDILASSIDKSDNKESEANDSNTVDDMTASGGDESTIKWEYKWSENDEVHGPFSSQEMADWQEQGYFKDGVLARRTDREGAQFYSSKRIDFDLYT